MHLAPRLLGTLCATALICLLSSTPALARESNEELLAMIESLQQQVDELRQIVEQTQGQTAETDAKVEAVAEVIESKGCHSGHIVGQKLIFDNSGNLLTKENPDRVCSFLMPNLTVLINAFFENLMNGRDPNEVMFNTSGCFDTGPSCGGWGHVVVKMSAELFS